MLYVFGNDTNYFAFEFAFINKYNVVKPHWNKVEFYVFFPWMFSEIKWNEIKPTDIIFWHVV